MAISGGSVKNFAKGLAKQSAIRAALVALSQARAGFDPQLAYMWDIKFRDLFGGDSSEEISFYARDTTIPAATTEAITRRYLGNEYSFSGQQTSPNTYRVTFYDQQGLTVMRYFEAWRRLSNQSISGIKASPMVYKRDIVLSLKDNTDTIVTDSLLFKGAFPIEISDATLSYSNSDLIQFDVVFKFQHRIFGGK